MFIYRVFFLTDAGECWVDISAYSEQDAIDIFRVSYCNPISAVVLMR